MCFVSKNDIFVNKLQGWTNELLRALWSRLRPLHMELNFSVHRKSTPPPPPFFLKLYFYIWVTCNIGIYTEFFQHVLLEKPSVVLHQTLILINTMNYTAFAIDCSYKKKKPEIRKWWANPFPFCALTQKWVPVMLECFWSVWLPFKSVWVMC